MEGAGRRAENIRVCNRVAHAGERRQGSPEPRARSGMRGSPDPREAVGRGAPAEVVTLLTVFELIHYVASCIQSWNNVVKCIYTKI